MDEETEDEEASAPGHPALPEVELQGMRLGGGDVEVRGASMMGSMVGRVMDFGHDMLRRLRCGILGRRNGFGFGMVGCGGHGRKGEERMKVET
jgi:hypothetical protein